MNKIAKWLFCCFCFVLCIYLVGCSRIYYSLSGKPSYQIPIIKDGLKISLLIVEPDEKELQNIYKQNNISEKELAENELLLIKTTFVNLTRKNKDISSFVNQLMGEHKENNISKAFWITPRTKGIKLPEELGYFTINKITTLAPKSSLERYVPVWMPKDSTLIVLCIANQSNPFRTLYTFHFFD
ncbi:hypothetical protein LLG10_01875 [bacterium]|nr:hypothetical protein [bacterium]